MLTIRTLDGRNFKGIVLSQTATNMRLAIKGSDDVMEVLFVDDRWITETGEIVEIFYEWEYQPLQKSVCEADFICSPELAARLINLLQAGDQPQESSSPAAPKENTMRAAGWIV